MHWVDFVPARDALVPLLLMRPSLMSLLVVAAIGVLVHEARGVLGRSRSIAFRAHGRAQTAARRDGRRVRWAAAEDGGPAPAYEKIRIDSERDGNAAPARIEAAAAPVAPAPRAATADGDAWRVQGAARPVRRAPAGTRAGASRRAHAARVAPWIAMACLIAGAVAGWLAVRAARRGPV
jgi:hypothetical protein